eukprot:scaffold210763_cov69-Attheya_sp.AAC.5
MECIPGQQNMCSVPQQSLGCGTKLSMDHYCAVTRDMYGVMEMILRCIRRWTLPKNVGEDADKEKAVVAPRESNGADKEVAAADKDLNHDRLRKRPRIVKRPRRVYNKAALQAAKDSKAAKESNKAAAAMLGFGLGGFLASTTHHCPDRRRNIHAICGTEMEEGIHCVLCPALEDISAHVDDVLLLTTTTTTTTTACVEVVLLIREVNWGESLADVMVNR